MAASTEMTSALEEVEVVVVEEEEEEEEEESRCVIGLIVYVSACLPLEM